MKEEQLKANLIIGNDSYKQAIFDTEDTNFFQGRINFALYCIDYDETQNNFDATKLAVIQKVIEKYLDKEVTNDLRRGLLTIADEKGLYNYYNYWWSFSYAVNANKRCLIDKYYELEYYVYGNYKERDYCKEYLKKLLLQLTTKDLKDIISDFIPPKDMPIPDDGSCCYLLKGMRPRDIDDCEQIV